VMKVGVVAIGSIEQRWSDAVERHIRAVFGFSTERLPPLDRVEFALDERRAQYSSSLILRELATLGPLAVSRVVGITECDIFIPMLKFVFGQAQLGGQIAVISLARLRQEFYGLPSDAELLDLRMKKVLVHELGHTFGLTHCTDRTCVMVLSTNLDQLDAKLDAFCGSCLGLIREHLGNVDHE